MHITKGFLIPVLIILFYFFVIFLVTFPAVLHFGSQYIGDGFDNYQFSGYQLAVWDNLSHGKHPFAFTNIWRYPVGFNFGYSFDGVFATLVGAILLPFLGIITAYNISLILSLLVNLLCSHRFFYHLTHNYFLTILGSIIYGLSFYVLARGGGHINLLFVAGWPLLFDAVYALSSDRKPDKIYYWQLFISVLLLAMGSLQYLLFLLIIMFVQGVCSYFFARAKITNLFNNLKNKARLTTISAITIACIFIFFFGPYFYGFTFGLLEHGDRFKQWQLYHASLIDFVTPNPYLPTLLNRFFPATKIIPSIEKCVFIGWIELMLLGIYLLNLKLKKQLNLILPIIVLILLALSVKYELLIKIFPFSGIAEPHRLFVVFYLYLVSFMVLGLKHIFGNRRFIPILLLLILLVLIERTRGTYFLSPSINNQYQDIVAQQPGKAVLDIPISPYFAQYDLLPYYYYKKIVNGYIHWAGNNEKTLSFVYKPPLMGFHCGLDPYYSKSQSVDSQRQHLLQLLVQNDIKTIVLHQDWNDNYINCQNARNWASYLFTGKYVTGDNSIIIPDQIMVNPSKNNEIQVIQYSKAGDNTSMVVNLIFPRDGIFVLHGLSIFPKQNFPLDVQYENQDIGKKINFWFEKEPNLMATVDIGFKLSVKKDTGVVISRSEKTTQSTYISIWYEFIPQTSISEVSKYTVIPVYNDNQYTVLNIK